MGKQAFKQNCKNQTIFAVHLQEIGTNKKHEPDLPLYRRFFHQ